MQVRRLSLTNFRNYARLELDLPGGVVLLHGDNAQGKTNLLEAIYFLATTRSPHATQDQQLVNWDAMQSDEPVVVGRLVADVDRPCLLYTSDAADERTSGDLGGRRFIKKKNKDKIKRA